MPIHFESEEPPTTCKRSDCVICDRGTTVQTIDSYNRYDKHGEALPPRPIKTTTHRFCETCDLEWIIRSSANEPSKVVRLSNKLEVDS